MGYPVFPSPKICAKICKSGQSRFPASALLLIFVKIFALRTVLTILLVLFILIQFFPVDKTNPPVNKGMDFLTVKQTPEPLAKIIRASCYDCHSNETTYPAYTRIQPFGWFMKNHIDEGRQHLNFSLFATYEPKRQAHKMDESVEMIENGEMPLESYLLMHSKAKLTDAQRAELMAYFKRIAEETRSANNLAAPAN